MASIFTRIVRGDIPSYKLAETEDFFAFLDINPLQKGHALVIPKKEIDYLFDIDDDIYSGLLLFSKKLAQSIKACIPCERIGVVVMGLEVPHAHIHLIPINSMDDMNFANPKLKLEREEFLEIADQISNHFNTLSG